MAEGKLSRRTGDESDRKRVLITGASGCVGHYLVEELLTETHHDLLLVVRDRSKLSPELRDCPRLSIVEADLASPEMVLQELSDVDAAVLAATAWGGADTFAVNVDANMKIARYLAEKGGRKIVYLSTASVLDRRLNLLGDARIFGTDYIRSKHRMVEGLEAVSKEIEILGLFPTLVLGGDETKPYSHFARLLAKARPWARLIRRLRAPGRFHVIHARDLARVIRAVVDDARPTPIGAPRRYVVGLPAASTEEAITAFTSHLGQLPVVRITLGQSLVSVLVGLFRIRLSAWDRYCLRHLDQSFPDAVDPSGFGMSCSCPTLEAAIESVVPQPETLRRA